MPVAPFSEWSITITQDNVAAVVIRPASVDLTHYITSISGSFSAAQTAAKLMMLKDDVVQQVETATAAGTVTLAGNAQAVVTAAGMPGSPRTVLFAVALNDTPAVWAGKCRTALAADPNVNGFFIVSGTGTAIVLTARSGAANDATMNIALNNSTSTGITAAPTSADTAAGEAAVIGNFHVFDNRDVVFATPIRLSPNSAAELSLPASGTPGQLGAVTMTGYTR